MEFVKTFRNNIKNIEWGCIKIPLIYIWYKVIKHCLMAGYSVPIPLGICKLLNCAFAFGELGSTLFIVIAFVFSFAYILDFHMKWVCLGLFCISVIIFTGEESSGILKRNGVFSYLFFAQAIAYWFHSTQPNKLQYKRIQYSIQAVAVGYFLSACSKLLDSGFSWPSDGSRITLQVLKSFHYEYYTTLDAKELSMANELVQFLTESQSTLTLLLSATLFLEFFVLTAAINKTVARFYGFALLLMHIGIHYFMDVLITSFAFPMVIIFINPIFLIVLLINKGIYKTKSLTT